MRAVVFLAAVARVVVFFAAVLRAAAVLFAGLLRAVGFLAAVVEELLPTLAPFRFFCTDAIAAFAARWLG